MLARVRHVTHCAITQPRARVTNGDLLSCEQDGFADGARAVPRLDQIEPRKRPGGTRFDVRPEDGNTDRPLDQFHRATPPRIHFDRIRHALARDEVDTVDPDEIKRVGNCSSQGARRGHDSFVLLEVRVAGTERMLPRDLNPLAPNAGSPTN